MNNQISNNKRIAKNAFFMYLRMGITMVVGLFTSRIVLQQLGVEDYGLYNVIGGIVSMFIIFNNAMVNTTSRFITYRLAQKNILESRQIFSMSLLIHIGIAIWVLLLSETIGLWYLHNKMVIPDGREYAAEWLFQISIFTSTFAILTVPYNATIVAHEKMNAFAIIQVIDVFLKLAIVLFIAYSPFDKLIFYGSLIGFISLFDLFLYIFYCKNKFADCQFLLFWDNKTFQEMMRFAGWALVGNFCNFFYTQGINLMLNAFCGATANAARGIAVQVETMIKHFANNVQTAINPQIIKSYASDEKLRMYSLISVSSRYCFYLLYLLTLPILFKTNFLLELWLGQVPEHTVNFVRIILIITLFDAFVNPMFTANLASGKLKIYHLTLSILMYSFMLITYFSIKLTGIAESVFYSYLTATIIGYIMKIFILEKQVGYKVVDYVVNVCAPVIMVILTSILFPILTNKIVPYGWPSFLITGFVSVISVLSSVWLFGMRKDEKIYVATFIKNKLLNR